MVYGNLFRTIFIKIYCTGFEDEREFGSYQAREHNEMLERAKYIVDRAVKHKKVRHILNSFVRTQRR